MYIEDMAGGKSLWWICLGIRKYLKAIIEDNAITMNEDILKLKFIYLNK